MSEVKHPSTIINVQGDNIPYRECAYIERLKDATESLAIWGSTTPGGRYQYAIAGRNGSRKHPSTIRGSKFNFTVPDTAKISSIIVEYRYRKMQYSSPIGQTAHGSFGNPTIRMAFITSHPTMGRDSIRERECGRFLRRPSLRISGTGILI